MKVMFLKKIDIYYAKGATIVQRFVVSLTKLGTHDGIRWFDGNYYNINLKPKVKTIAPKNIGTYTMHK
jgi:hypothetical protein